MYVLWNSCRFGKDCFYCHDIPSVVNESNDLKEKVISLENNIKVLADTIKELSNELSEVKHEMKESDKINSKIVEKDKGEASNGDFLCPEYKYSCSHLSHPFYGVVFSRQDIEVGLSISILLH